MLDNYKNKCSISIQSIIAVTVLSLYSQASIAASDATVIKHNPATLAGGSVEVEMEGGGDVRWILPGQRKLDPKLFGTPEKPLGFEPDVGVPLAMRLKNADASAWTMTAMPTPFSDNYKPSSGEYELKLKDKTIYDHPLSEDEVKFSTTFTSPDGLNNYKLMVDKVIPIGLQHPIMGGVGTNFLQHGMTGIGTKLMPTAFTYVAFWGVGTLEVNGVEVANNRVVHLMTTCSVRDADYKLVFDDGVDCSKLQTHLLMPNEIFTANGPERSPVPTGFILPNGMEQPFIHLMFGSNKVSGVETVE